ncbi:MAG: chloride channel protein [Deltaproteobacteria bacterium]|nr:chloride channel protein [Deltaproteobacteria bacterium]
MNVTHRAAVDVVGGALVGVLAGLSAAVFLCGLDVVTHWREGHDDVVFLLPIAAALLLVVVARFGGVASSGTNLVLWRAADGRGDPLPLRLFPLALLGTWWTHLFGGSAGREGTAVQMGGAVADVVTGLGSRLWAFDDEDRRRLLLAGIAGGFGGVFGTPIAAAVFAIEVVKTRRLDVARALPALVAAFAGDVVGSAVLHALGGAHGAYPQVARFDLDARFVVVGVAVGLAARAFGLVVTFVKARTARWLPHWRGVAGGVAVVVVWQLAGSQVLGLSLPTLMDAVHGRDVDDAFFLFKLLATAVTIGVGLIGGEVTPLFAIGASLGSTIAGPLGLPSSLTAVCAMAALFGVSARVPFALCIMAVELCGAAVLPHVVVVVAVASLILGDRSIYLRR